MVDSPPLLSMEAAAEYIGVSYNTMRRLVNRGQIPCVRYPSLVNPDKRMRKKLIFLKDLDSFMDAAGRKKDDDDPDRLPSDAEMHEFLAKLDPDKVIARLKGDKR